MDATSKRETGRGASESTDDPTSDAEDTNGTTPSKKKGRERHVRAWRGQTVGTTLYSSLTTEQRTHGENLRYGGSNTRAKGSRIKEWRERTKEIWR